MKSYVQWCQPQCSPYHWLEIEEDGAWRDNLLRAIECRRLRRADRFALGFPRSHSLFRGGLLPRAKTSRRSSPLMTPLSFSARPFFSITLSFPATLSRPARNCDKITNSPQDAAALAGTSIVGNIPAAAKYLTSHVNPVDRSAPSRTQEPEPKPEHPMTTAFVFYTLNKLLPRDTNIAEECPSSKGDLDRYISLRRAWLFYSVRTGMWGFALPAAWGLQLADPKRRWSARLAMARRNIRFRRYGRPCSRSSCNISRHLQRKLLRTERFSRLHAGRKKCPGHRHSQRHRQNRPRLRHECARRRSPRGSQISSKMRLSSQEPILISVNVQQGCQKTMGMDQSVNPPNYG